jgi:hypothetical protein
MLRTSAALLMGLSLWTLIVPSQMALAQQAAKTGLHDDTSGRLTEIPIRKENLAFANASAELTFDVDYVYKSSTLVGEPLLLCGAKLSNPKGTISFNHRDANHQVEVTSQNADKINPHHLDLLVAYRLPDSRVFYASCDTGLVGTWAREAYNLSTSPSWDRFLCEVAPIVIAHHVSNQPRPNRIGREWCESMQGRYLDAEAAKELFRTRELRASGFVVASLSLDVADLVLDQTRTGLADRIAQRMQVQLEGALAVSKPGMLASAGERETWEALNDEVRARLDAAAAMETATERARALREAIRAVLAAEGSDDGSAETLRAVQQALAGRLSAPAEREFAEREREEANRLQSERDRIVGSVQTQLQSARAAADAAPEFRFASEGGPADIVRIIRQLNHDLGLISTVTFSPDGKYFALAGSTGFSLWETESGLENRFSGDTHYSAAFSPDGRYIVTGDERGARLWDVRSGESVATLAAGKNPIRKVSTVAFSPNGQHVLIGGYEHLSYRLLEVSTGKIVHEFYVEDWGHSAALSPDGKLLLTQSRNGNIILWDITSGRKIRSFDGGRNSVDSFSPDGRYVLGVKRERISLWDPQSGQIQHEFLHPNGRWLGAAVSPDGRYIISGGTDTNVSIWEVETGRQVRSLEGHRFHSRGAEVTFSADGRLALTADVGDLTIWGPEE